ncbi:hypothetical protein [Bifidobacterium bohemicum]
MHGWDTGNVTDMTEMLPPNLNALR